jgi:hypothetical protein
MARSLEGLPSLHRGNFSAVGTDGVLMHFIHSLPLPSLQRGYFSTVGTDGVSCVRLCVCEAVSLHAVHDVVVNTFRLDNVDRVDIRSQVA